ncbi:integral membrane protein [Aspergillus coremiiformis]|uniref:Integral membrane protein n=1 Tax=Aspergillus coremiiformis TaxID=138285 RepID=A0A5N6Z266_9EURO|nr:integral membrane protein [Aspergillus coremiiformis]
MSTQHIVHPRGDETKSYLSNGGKSGMAVSISFTVLATIFVLARVYTRAGIMKRMEPNDYMVLIALVLSYVFMAFFIIESFHGMGMHGADIPPAILLKQMKAFWITIPFYNAALLSAKASILLQYFRVFPTSRMRLINWTMLGILGIYGSWAVLSGFLNCIPVAKFWDKTIPGYCLAEKGLWFSNASMHIATDLAILVIPIPALSQLDLPKRQKIALITVFALGGFVCITSVCRLVSLKKIADSTDPTFDNVGAATWSAVECNVGIICACLPTLRPLVSRIVPHLLSTLSSRSRSYYNQSYSNGQLNSPHARGPAYWGGPGMGTVSTTITAMDDLEFGNPCAESDRVLTLVPGADIHGKAKLVLKETKSMEDASERVGTGVGSAISR